MSTSPGIKIAAAAGAALIIVLYARSSRTPDHPDSVATTEIPAPRQQVEQRLRQLHAAHDRSSRERQPGTDAAGGKIEAHGAVAPKVGRVQRPPLGAPAVPNGGAADQPDDGDQDVDADDIPALKNIALRDTDPERRLAAVTMLGASEDPTAVPVLAQALSDEDDEVRMAAIQALSDFTGDAPIDLLSKVAVDDPSADNRYEALEALSDLGGERVLSTVQQALNDPDEDVRALAEGMLDNQDSYQDEADGTADGAAPAPQDTPAH
jgi:hypothetical protein